MMMCSFLLLLVLRKLCSDSFFSIVCSKVVVFCMCG